MELVRAAIFSALGEKVTGANVLDLFAGSGAFGLEALSRGASSSTFVDDHPKAIAAIKANLEKTRLKGDVIRSDAFRFLGQSDRKFDLIFADPPYSKHPRDKDFVTELLESKTLVDRLAPDGFLILEKTAGNVASAANGWRTLRDRKYGSSRVLFLVRS